MIEFGSENFVVNDDDAVNDSILADESMPLDSLENSQESCFSTTNSETPNTSKKCNRSLKRSKIDREEKFNTAIDAFVKQAGMTPPMMRPAEQENMYTAFGKSISFQLAKLSLVAATEAMSDIQHILSTKIQSESRANILQTAMCESEVEYYE